MENINSIYENRKDIKTDKGVIMLIQKKLYELIEFPDQIAQISFMSAYSEDIRNILNENQDIVDVAKEGGEQGYEKAARMLKEKLDEAIADREKPTAH